MPTFAIACYFDRGYIAHPYWPEMAQLIDITKKSGLARAKSEKNRRAALTEYLEQHDMTLTDYERLEQLAARPFHTIDTGEIILPTEQVHAFLVNTTDTIRSAGRPCQTHQVRNLIDASPWRTEKMKPDGIWERFAVVSSGTGGKLSNQRGLRRSAFIRDFEARGTVRVNAQYVKPDVLRNAIAWGGENIGIGASRKMGWGRFVLKQWEETSA